MSIRINLWRTLSGGKPRILLENNGFIVTSFRYNSGVEGLKIANSRGHSIILLWVGQMIWDAQFDGYGLIMCSMSRQPKPATEAIETYGCLVFHPGLLTNGRPSVEDTHLLRGKITCAAMNEAWPELDGDMLCLNGRYEYVMDFGHHCLAQPTVVLHKSSTLLGIRMAVIDLASVDMPLQYMCCMNCAYIPSATSSQNIPDEILRLRESVPSYANPITQRLTFNRRIMQEKTPLPTLSQPEFYDPEIVFFVDRLDAYTDQPEFRMISLDGTMFVTRFYSAELNYVIRWILYDGEQQVAALALLATCRPEGCLAV